MTWKHYLNQGRLEGHSTSKQEIDDLRGLVARNLKDAALPALSADNRFGLAYEAGLILAKMVLACAGYRVKGVGHHKTTFEVLPLALGSKVQPTADYFEQCRRERNTISYDAAGTVSKTSAEEALKEATEFESAVESWITKNYPSLRR
jgi:hypothetical protein